MSAKGQIPIPNTAQSEEKPEVESLYMETKTGKYGFINMVMNIKSCVMHIWKVQAFWDMRVLSALQIILHR